MDEADAVPHQGNIDHPMPAEDWAMAEVRRVSTYELPSERDDVPMPVPVPVPTTKTSVPFRDDSIIWRNTSRKAAVQS